MKKFLNIAFFIILICTNSCFSKEAVFKINGIKTVENGKLTPCTGEAYQKYILVNENKIIRTTSLDTANDIDFSAAVEYKVFKKKELDQNKYHYVGISQTNEDYIIIDEDFKTITKINLGFGNYVNIWYGKAIK